MASRRKSTTPCMVLSSDQDPDLELISDLDEGPPVLTPVENTKTESISSDEEIHGSVDSDNQPKKVEGGYECKYCTFQTPDLNMFTFHVDSEHPTVVLNSSYVCVECNFLTKRYDALSEHNLKYHPGEENFKLTMVKRNNQTIFEQTVNDLTFDGSFVKEENSEQAESADAPSSGISISKTPIMKMMKNKVENKRITVHHNSAEEAPEEKENDIKPDREDAVENPSSSASDSSPSSSVVNRIHPTPAHTVVSPAAVLPGLAQVITAMSAQQNSNLIPKVLIPVNSIPSYNTALDNNPLLLNTYNKFPYPTVSEIAVLSAQAKYTEEQIKIWFSAQRLKHGVSWTPEEVEEARRKQFNGALHSVPQTITVIPTHISPASNGLPSILQTCQIVGQPGLVLTQVAGANPLPVSAPIALTVAGVPNQTSVQKSQVPAAAQPVAEAKPPAAATATVTTVTAAAGPASQLVKPESTPPNPANPDSLGIRAKKTKEQLAELKVSYLQSQFPPDAEITRLMKITGLTKGEIKKWFSDTRYNQRNAKGHQGPSLGSDPAAPIVIDSSDETAESSPGGPAQPRAAWTPGPDGVAPRAKEKTAEQLRALQASFLRSAALTDEEAGRLRAQTRLSRREIDAWFSERSKAQAPPEGPAEAGKAEKAGAADDGRAVEGGAREERAREERGDASPGEEPGAPKAAKVCKKTPEQLHMLKSAFVRTQWPSPEEYDRLAEESGLARTDIVSWFGDTRYAWKNGNLKWYYYYQSATSSGLNGLGHRRRGRGRPKGRGRGRARGRARGGRRPAHWDRALPLIKFKTGTAILKDYYVKHKFLNEQDLDELVNRSHMGYEQVREWFAERQRRAELGLELFEEEEEEDEEPEEGLDEQEEEDDEETDDSDTWEPPRHVKRKLSKSDD